MSRSTCTGREGKVYMGRSLQKDMAHVNVEAGLRSLWTSLREMKDLLAWRELVEAEKKPGQPPSFSIDHHINEELRFQYGFFVKTALDIHEFLNAKDVDVGSKEQRERRRDRGHREETGPRAREHPPRVEDKLSPQLQYLLLRSPCLLTVPFHGEEWCGLLPGDR